MKKCLSVLLSMLMLIACLSGCGSKPAEAPAASSTPDTASEDKVSGSVIEVAEDANTKYQETITIGINADGVNKDIQNSSSVIDRSNTVLAFNSLIEWDTENSKAVPGLATEWEQVSDLEWQFALRQGVKFHDGTDFTAEDVQFTFERGLMQTQSKGKLNTLDHVEVVDEYTVKLVLTKNDPDIIYKLCDVCTVIFSKDAFDSMSEEEAVLIGTGPYMYTEWEQGSHFSFTRFDDYWDGAKKTKNIILKYIPEGSARLIALQTGEVDACLEPPATDMHYVSEDESLVLYQLNGTNLRYVWLNVNVAPFDNKLVRQAVASAINRDDVIAMVYNGNATPAYNVMHPDNEYADPNINYQEYSIERAKELLTEAGYPDGFNCTIYCTTGNTQKSVATVIQAMLGNIGINVEVNSQESATFNAGVKHGGTFDMAVDGWGGYVMGPDYALRSVFHSEGSTNRCNIEDEYVDSLLEAGLSSTDFETRCKSYYELQNYLMDECVWIPLAIERINIATKNTLQGFTMPHGITENYRDLYIIEQ